MPIYEYACSDCRNEFEALVRSDTTPECPSRHFTKLEKLLSVFATTAASGRDVPAMAGPCGGCPNAGGQGSCSFNH